MAEEDHWPYNPSIAAAIIFALLFGAFTIFHAFRLFRTRTWFCIPLVIGGLCEFKISRIDTTASELVYS
jgi:hypothetical protein